AARLIHRCHDGDLLARLHAHAHFFTGRNQVARDINSLLVDLDVTVANELSRGLAARGETHAVHNVVETALESGEKIVAGDARHRGDALERVAELVLAHAIDALDLLLLTKLLRILRHLATAGGRRSVLTRGRRTTLDGALLGKALGSLEKQLGSFATALAAAWSGIAHGSDSPALGRTAAVMRNRGHVLDGLDLKSRGDERLNRRLTSRSRSLNSDVYTTNAQGHCFASSLL